jgi:hypothetical protein
VQQLLVGSWHACGGSVFGTDEAGLAFNADGSWFKLDVAADGSLQERSGSGELGTWTTIDTTVVNGPGSYQINLESDTGDVVHSMPVFATEPAKMRLDDVGARRTDYARLTPYASVPEPWHPATSDPLDLPDRTRFEELRADCDSLASDLDPAQASERLADNVLGVWVACGSGSVFDTDEVGLELSDDGRFYKLYVAEHGGLERGEGFDETGSWQIVETELGAAAGDYLELRVFGSRRISAHPELLRDPAAMRLGFQGAPRVLYVSGAK